MDEDEKEKEKRDASEVSENKKKEHVKAFFAGLRALLQRHGYPVKGDRAKTLKEGKVNPETSREISNWIPSFHSYEDFNRMTLHSLDGFMIIVSTDGVIIYVAENISSLLGHLPDDIVGKKLLSLLPDEEKNEVYRKIAIKLPLSMSGKHINFCCRLKRGDAEHYSHPAYECVKFLLTIKDISDEPLALLRSFFPSQPSSAELPLEDRFYLVGTVCTLRAQILRELFAIKEAGKDVPPMVSDSPEGHLSSDHRSVQGQRRSSRMGLLNAEPDGPASEDQVNTVAVEQYGPQESVYVINVESDTAYDSCTSSSESTSKSSATSSLQSFESDPELGHVNYMDEVEQTEHMDQMYEMEEVDQVDEGDEEDQYVQEDEEGQVYQVFQDEQEDQVYHLYHDKQDDRVYHVYQVYQEDQVDRVYLEDQEDQKDQVYLEDQEDQVYQVYQVYQEDQEDLEDQKDQVDLEDQEDQKDQVYLEDQKDLVYQVYQEDQEDQVDQVDLEDQKDQVYLEDQKDLVYQVYQEDQEDQEDQVDLEDLEDQEDQKDQVYLEDQEDPEDQVDWVYLEDLEDQEDQKDQVYLEDQEDQEDQVDRVYLEDLEDQEDQEDEVYLEDQEDQEDQVSLEDQEDQMDQQDQEDQVSLEDQEDQVYLEDQEDQVYQEDQVAQEDQVEQEPLLSSSMAADISDELPPAIVSYLERREMELMKKFREQLEEESQMLQADIKTQRDALEILKEQLQAMQDSMLQASTLRHVRSPELQSLEPVAKKQRIEPVESSFWDLEEDMYCCGSCSFESFQFPEELEEPCDLSTQLLFPEEDKYLQQEEQQVEDERLQEQPQKPDFIVDNQTLQICLPGQTGLSLAMFEDTLMFMQNQPTVVAAPLPTDENIGGQENRSHGFLPEDQLGPSPSPRPLLPHSPNSETLSSTSFPQSPPSSESTLTTVETPEDDTQLWQQPQDLQHHLYLRGSAWPSGEEATWQDHITWAQVPTPEADVQSPLDGDTVQEQISCLMSVERADLDE